MGSGTLVPVKFYSFPRSRYSHYFFVLADRYILEEKENNNKKRGPTLRREVFTTVSQLPICFSFSLFFFSPGNQLDGHSKWYVCPSVQVWWESTSYGNRGFFKKKRTRRRKYNIALEENHLCCVPFRPETDVLLSNGCHGNMAPQYIDDPYWQSWWCCIRYEIIESKRDRAHSSLGWTRPGIARSVTKTGGVEPAEFYHHLVFLFPKQMIIIWTKVKLYTHRWHGRARFPVVCTSRAQAL